MHTLYGILITVGAQRSNSMIQFDKVLQVKQVKPVKPVKPAHIHTNTYIPVHVCRQVHTCKHVHTPTHPQTHHSRERDNNQEGSVVSLCLHEVADESNGLDGLPKTHLICQDPVEVVVVERHQPLQTFNLTHKFMYSSKHTH